MASRIDKKVARTEPVTVTINGNVVAAYAGETIASIVFTENINIFYRTRSNKPKAPFCNMGTCFECQVKVKRKNTDASATWLRACSTLAEEGMVIVTGDVMHAMGSTHATD